MTFFFHSNKFIILWWKGIVSTVSVQKYEDNTPENNWVKKKFVMSVPVKQIQYIYCRCNWGDVLLAAKGLNLHLILYANPSFLSSLSFWVSFLPTNPFYFLSFPSLGLLPVSHKRCTFLFAEYKNTSVWVLNYKWYVNQESYMWFWCKHVFCVWKIYCPENSPPTSRPPINAFYVRLSTPVFQILQTLCTCFYPSL